MEAVVCQSHTLQTFIANLYLQTFIAVSHWSLTLLGYQYCILTGTSFWYHVVLCHRDPVTLNLQDHLFHVLQQFINEIDVPVGQLKGLGVSWVGQSTSFPVPALPGRALSRAVCLAHSMLKLAWGRVSSSAFMAHTFTISTNSAVLYRQGWGAGSLLSFVVGEGWGQLSLSHDLGASSPACHRQWEAKGRGRGRKKEEDENAISPSITPPWGWLTFAPHHQGQLYCTAQAGC